MCPQLRERESALHRRSRTEFSTRGSGDELAGWLVCRFSFSPASRIRTAEHPRALNNRT